MKHLIGPHPTLSSAVRSTCAIIAVLSFFNSYCFSNANTENNQSAIFVLIVFLIGIVDTAIAYWSDNKLWNRKAGQIFLLVCSIAHFWALVAGFYIVGSNTVSSNYVVFSVLICSAIVCAAIFTETIFCFLCKLSIIELRSDKRDKAENIICPHGTMEAKP